MSALRAPFALAPVTVVAGHYGVGKTNFALNVALDAAHAGAEVCVVDLDVVNPYFRSTEYRALLEGAGVRVVAPVFAEAGSSLDVPSLTGAVVPAIEWVFEASGVAGTRELAGACECGELGLRDGGEAGARDGGAAFSFPPRITIIDAGGDDAGASALGRFARSITRGAYALIYVVNCYRNLTQDAQSALEVLREIERASRLKATAVASNAHLSGETTADEVVRGAAHAREVAQAARLPLACATVPKSLVSPETACDLAQQAGARLYPISVLVRAPWDERA